MTLIQGLKFTEDVRFCVPQTCLLTRQCVETELFNNKLKPT